MPGYDFICQKCSTQFEVQLSMSEYTEHPRRRCPQCGSRQTVRVFARFNVLTPRRGGADPGGACGPGCCS